MEYKIYLSGEFITSQSPLPVKDPFSGEIVANTFLAGKEELEIAIKKALTIQEELKQLASFEKYKILFQIADLLTIDKNRLAEVLCKESGKPFKYALAEIERSIQTFKVAAEESKRIPGEYMQMDWTAAGEGKEAWIKYFPVGLIAGISPFNFPLNLAVHKIAPAIATGCPIILKPASSTPLSTLELAKIIDLTSLPKGAVSILPMDRIAGNLLVTDRRIKLLTFTGSPQVGWKMKAEAGKKKTVLELGGNAGVIVTGSANLEVAIPKCVIGGFSYSGQVCIHAQRIYVHKDIFNDFSNKFIQAVKNLKVGDPKFPETDISVMIDEANAIRVEDWVNEAVSQGARVLSGGKRNGNYYEPTILTNTRTEMKVCSLEIFGPVVTLESYDNFEQVIDEVNNSDFGLQAGVFTNNLKEMDIAFYKLQVGGVIINDVPTFRVDHMPYGGVKDSGMGREGVKYAMMDMLEAKILVKNIF